MKQVLIGILTILMLTGNFLATADAGSKKNNANIMVSARVKPVLEMKVMDQVSSIEVTWEDIKRGYVDVERETVVHVRSNSRDGYYLVFDSMDSSFSEAMVLDGGRSTLLSGLRGLVYQPYSGSYQGEIKKLQFRLFLKADATSGSFPWPFSMNVTL